VRNCAAALVIAAGALLIGALWFRDLTGQALLDALIGAVYLFIGIGLFGRSRFTLFLAITAPAAHLVFLANTTGLAGTTDPLHQIQLLADLIVILCSAWVLWQVRHDPSV
jgi:hypothetical protein